MLAEMFEIYLWIIVGFLFPFMIFIIIFSYLTRGRETLVLVFPEKSIDDLLKTAEHYFIDKAIPFVRSYNRVVGREGSYKRLGERVYDLTAANTKEGPQLTCVFYLRSWFPYWEVPFCEGFCIGFVPRNKGWKHRVALLERLGFDEKRHVVR